MLQTTSRYFIHRVPQLNDFLVDFMLCVQWWSILTCVIRTHWRPALSFYGWINDWLIYLRSPTTVAAGWATAISFLLSDNYNLIIPVRLTCFSVWSDLTIAFIIVLTCYESRSAKHTKLGYFWCGKVHSWIKLWLWVTLVRRWPCTICIKSDSLPT